MPYPLSQWSTTCPVGQLMCDQLGDAQTCLHHIMCKLTDIRRQKLQVTVSTELFFGVGLVRLSTLGSRTVERSGTQLCK